MRQGLKAHGCNARIHLLRAIVLAAGVAAALAIYLVMSLYIIPLSFQESPSIIRPEPVVSGVTLSSQQIALGENLTISVTGTNRGDSADMQIVSIGFPNLTASSEVEVLRHDFRQTPIAIERGDNVGTGYTGSNSVLAQYPSIEAFSRPWDRGASYTVDLQAEPLAEGRFVILVKCVAFPHTWDSAHFPHGGMADYQQEFVESYVIQVTKS